MIPQRVVTHTKPVVIHNANAISFMKTKEDNEFDLCFTSPPYFDAEKYDEGNQQSSDLFRSYGKWMECWLLPSVLEACRTSSLVLINMANTGAYRIADDLRNFSSKEGILRFEHVIKYRTFGGKIRSEPLFGLSFEDIQTC